MIPNTWREYLFRLRFTRLSRQAQRQLLSKSSTIVDPAALWQRVEAELKSVPHKKRVKRSLKPGWTLSFALLMVLPFLFLFTPSRTHSSYLKSGSDSLEPWPTSTLGYALMDHKGQIARGDAGARVHQQTELALYVETPGLAAGRKFVVAIVVQHPDGRRETLLDDYRVGEEFEILKGKSGIFIFRPEQNGVYQFKGMRMIGGRVEDVPGFQVEFYP